MNEQPEDIHVPPPSFWPILLAFGLWCISFGVIVNPYLSIAGLVILLVAIAGWTLENRAENKEEEHD